MKSNSALIVGCGDLGIRTGRILQRQEWSVAGLCRDPARLPGGFGQYAADYTLPGDLEIVGKQQPDFVLATFTPSDRSAQGYQQGFTGAAGNLLRGLGEHKPRLLIMASSTRVYAESQGGWVDEDSPLEREEPMARAIVEAEEILLQNLSRVTVVRFGGIYGSPGGRLLQRVKNGELCPADPPQYTNRIHREDCAGFLAHLFTAAAAGTKLAPVYTAVEDLPASRAEVEHWLREEMAVTQPIRETTAIARSHRRCRNNLLHQSGYQLLYPDYRSGYRALILAS